MKKAITIASASLLGSAVVAAIPIIIYRVLTLQDYSIGETVTNSDWLNFWGGYVGSIVAVLASLVAFLFTYIQNEKQHKLTREELKEQHRLQILPRIGISEDFAFIVDENTYIHFVDMTDEKSKSIFKYGSLDILPAYQAWRIQARAQFNVFKTTISNIGLAAVVDLELFYNNGSTYLGCLQNGAAIEVVFLIKEPRETSEYNFSFVYLDVNQNRYEQAYKVRLTFDSTAERAFESHVGEQKRLPAIPSCKTQS